MVGLWAVYRVFRGISAAASLKQVFDGYAELGRDGRFPRHFCRGLIEAYIVSDNGAGPSSVFCGISAAASLKRENAAEVRGIRQEFSAAFLPRPH